MVGCDPLLRRRLDCLPLSVITRIFLRKNETSERRKSQQNNGLMRRFRVVATSTDVNLEQRTLSSFRPFRYVLGTSFIFFHSSQISNFIACDVSEYRLRRLSIVEIHIQEFRVICTKVCTYIRGCISPIDKSNYHQLRIPSTCELHKPHFHRITRSECGVRIVRYLPTKSEEERLYARFSNGDIAERKGNAGRLSLTENTPYCLSGKYCLGPQLSRS